MMDWKRLATMLSVSGIWMFALGQFVLGADPTYERDIRPILKANCFRCHGEGKQLEGNLDLRLRRLTVQGGDSGEAVIPGDADHSELFKRVRDGEMPPAEVEKKLTSGEVDAIRLWIATGAKTLREEPAVADPSSYLTEEERGFWSFQPVNRPAAPSVKDAVRIRTPVDRFILNRLEMVGLGFSTEASKQTLVRRLYFDLTGLPPAPDDVAAFVADRRPDAYERLVDRLLASPEYGARWGRHWLDIAGYADSEGYHDDDTLRPDAWKYRDYVARAFNSDKPFDRFVVEQLAGDELIGRELKNLNADEAELLIATGFLRMAPDGTGSNGVDQNEARNDVVAKTIEVVSSSLMGLTVACAQCHNHRYDPISQLDYYAMRAVFEPALNWKDWRTPAARRMSLYTDADRARALEVEQQARKIDAARETKQNELIEQTFEKELAKLPAAQHTAIREARSASPNRRTPEQKKLLQQFPSVNVSAGSLYLYDSKAAAELKRMADDATKIRLQKPKEEFVRGLWEPIQTAPPQTFLFERGRFDQPQEPVPPQQPKVLAASYRVDIPLDDPAIPTTGRRLAFARWLTSDRHPLTARVLVNRIWMHYFGKGLVETPGDFGFLGARPSHPELLDWLASEFAGSGWSIKRLHRLLVTSTVYRQSAFRDPRGESIDPDNKLYWHMAIRRLEAEVFRDSLLSVSGQLHLKSEGPSVPVMADTVGQFIVGIENLNAGRPGEVIPLRGEEYRRSFYVQVRRSRPLSILDPFDMPRMEPNCTRRSASTVAPQSLLLMNSEFAAESAAAYAQRVRELAAGDILAQVRWAWRIAYADEPTDAELANATQFVLDQAIHFASHPPEPAPTPSKKTKPVADPQLEALTSFCHALLSSNRFLYVD